MLRERESSKRQVHHANEKDLQPISDRKSSTMERILLEQGSKRAWRNVRCNQIKNVGLGYASYWNVKTLRVCVAILNSRNRQPIKLGGGG